MIATLSKLETSSTRCSVGPLMLVGGFPCAELSVRELAFDGPLDARSATLVLSRGAAGFDADERRRVGRLAGAGVVILQPVALAGGDSRLVPLLVGRLRGADQKLSGREDGLEFVAECDWTIELQKPVVFEPPDVPVTLRAVVERLRLGLRTHLLPPAVARRVVPGSLFRARTVASLLQSLLERNGLVVQRDLEWTGHGVAEHRVLRSVAQGRTVRLGLTELANRTSAVRSLRAAHRTPRPVKRIARAAGRVVESTFGLLPAWDASRQNLPDAEYGKNTGAGFDGVAEVFRLWVLNEDGAYPTLPRFDPTPLFDEGRDIPPQPLRFGDTLTLDAAGRSLGFVVELSTDGGENYARYAGAFRVLRDRAGVDLDDATLAPSLLAAVRAGTARLRITATLQSPNPVEAVRYTGNPFAGDFAEEVIEAGGAFTYRQVLPSSKYFGSGMAADEADDRSRLAVWLAEQPELSRDPGRAALTTTGVAWPLRIGDRLEQLAGRRLSPDFADPSHGMTGATVMKLTHDYETDRTELELKI